MKEPYKCHRCKKVFDATTYPNIGFCPACDKTVEEEVKRSETVEFWKKVIEADRNSYTPIFPGK